MSGRNQHHFWQLLQRGFGVERKPNYTTVYAYRKGKIPFPVGTRNIGAEKDFFDFVPGEGADYLITKTEDKLQGLVKYLQNGGEVTNNHTEEIATLIAHLETRTNFLRQKFAESVLDLSGELNNWFSNPVTFRKMMRRYAKENADELAALLVDKIGDPEARATFIDFAVNNFDILGTDTIQTASDEAKASIKALISGIFEISKQAHVKSIISNAPFDGRMQRYLDLKFRSRTGFRESLICPDTMVTFLTSRKPKPFLDKDDQLEAVWIPLTSDVMLVGERSEGIDHTTDAILRILASTSHTTFIAKSDTYQLRSLSNRIGKNAQIITPGEILSLKRNTLADLT